MVDRDAIVGQEVPPQTVVIERGPLSLFARAVTDNDPIYQDPRVAKEAGFDAIPAPPTFGFAFHHQGLFPELQPEGSGKTNPIMAAIGALMKEGGLVLHGEQEFVYHRPVLAGDVLTSSGSIKDLYEKEGKAGGKMTFVRTETDWRDADDGLVLTSIMTLIHRA